MYFYSGFSLFVLGSCLFFALAGALVVSAAAIAAFGTSPDQSPNYWLHFTQLNSNSGSVLMMTLVVLFFISVFLTTNIIGSFLALHLVSRIRERGVKEGVLVWVQEVKDRFFAVVASIVDTSSSIRVSDPDESTGEKAGDDAHQEEEEGGSIAGSVGSTVVVTLEVENKREGEDGSEVEVKSGHQMDSAGTVNDVFNK